MILPSAGLSGRTNLLVAHYCLLSAVWSLGMDEQHACASKSKGTHSHEVGFTKYWLLERTRRFVGHKEVPHIYVMHISAHKLRLDQPIVWHDIISTYASFAHWHNMNSKLLLAPCCLSLSFGWWFRPAHTTGRETCVDQRQQRKCISRHGGPMLISKVVLSSVVTWCLLQREYDGSRYSCNQPLRIVWGMLTNSVALILFLNRSHCYGLLDKVDIGRYDLRTKEGHEIKCEFNSQASKFPFW